jgi:hypothetical protein
MPTATRRIPLLATLVIAAVLAMLASTTIPAEATGSHSANYSHSICWFTGAHKNNASGSAPSATSSYTDWDCNRSYVALKYLYWSDQYWTSGSYWYEYNVVFGPSNSTTVMSNHKARYGSSWSSSKYLY